MRLQLKEMTTKLKPYPAYKPSDINRMDKLPEHWELVQLGRIGFLFKGKGGTKEDEIFDGIPCVRYGDIYTQHQFFVRNSRACISQEYADNYSPIQYGDILFAGSGETIDEIGKSVVNLISGNAYCGGDIIVFRPSINTHAPFLGYATDCPQIAYQKSCMGRGITVMHIYSDALKYLNIALPPLSEQKAIVRYLEYVDGRIRRYISARQKLVKLLEEQKHALINRAVTRGLDPNVRLKPSGVEWLGDVPAHWEVLPGRACYLLKHLLNKGLQETTVLSLSYGQIKIRPEEKLHGLVPESFETYQIIEPADIICRPTDLQNDWTSLRFGLSQHRGIITSAYMCFHTRAPLTRGYGYTLLHTYDLMKVFYGLGSGLRQNLSWSDFKFLPCLVPPLPEQTAITEYLDKATTNIDCAIDRTRRQIELLSEYRTRLIADVVTGKLDVRDAAGQLPDEIERLEQHV